MKNACKHLEHTMWERDGKLYELVLGFAFWRLEHNSEVVNLPLTKHCPKPERLIAWITAAGFEKR
jgi:hypothetical protein